MSLPAYHGDCLRWWSPHGASNRLTKASKKSWQQDVNKELRKILAHSWERRTLCATNAQEKPELSLLPNLEALWKWQGMEAVIEDLVEGWWCQQCTQSTSAKWDLRNLYTHQLTSKKLNRNLCDNTQETAQIPQNLFRKGSKQSKLLTIILIGK